MTRAILFIAVLATTCSSILGTVSTSNAQLKRVPWTTSRVVGTPEPPPPYVAERIYAQAEFQKPVCMGDLPQSDRVFVVEQKGMIYSMPRAADGSQRSVFFDAKSLPELRAVYGLAFHPEFEQNRLCYMCYIGKPNLPLGTRVSEFRVTTGPHFRIVPESERVLLRWRSGGHNGGCLKFGPDGYLYISTGDSSPPAPADQYQTGQRLDDFESSILRIDVTATTNSPYGIPDDNPFVDTDDARPEIWAYGFRNPWRMSFDRQSGDLWVGDVGWQLWEMVFRVQRGGNYGWSIMEGPQLVHPRGKPGPSPILSPLLALPRADAASVTGGFVYHGNRLSELRGKYVYGDYVTGKIWALSHQNGRLTENVELAQTGMAIITFYENAQGELAFLDYNRGSIHRLVPRPEVKQTRDFPRRLSDTGLFADMNKQQPAAGVLPYQVNVPQWMDGAQVEHWLAIPGTGTIKLAKPKQRVPSQWGEFPSDTVLVKNIYAPRSDGSRAPIETQLLHLTTNNWRGNSGEWKGYSYVWNADRSDADLAPAEGAVIELPDELALAHGKKSWRIHSRGECYLCHNPWAGYRLAFTVPQLRGIEVAGGRDQLERLQQLQAVTLPPNEEWEETLVNIHDNNQSLEKRARSYLHVNCAHCHRFGGGGTARIDLRFTATWDETQLDSTPTQGLFDLTQARVVAPADPYRSTLFYRMAKLGPGRMPHIGSSEVDRQAAVLIHDWINDMPPAPNGVSADLARRHQALLKRATDNNADAIDALLKTTDGSLRLWQEVVRHPRAELRASVLQRVAEQPSPVVQDLFDNLRPQSKRRNRVQHETLAADQVLARSGSAANGRKLFFQDKNAKCVNCHRVGSQGKFIGPDLSNIAEERSAQQLLDSLLRPSRTIDSQFRTYVVTTLAGKVHTGILAERSPTQLLIRGVDGMTVRVAAEDVDELKLSPQSLMPELAGSALNVDQVADLLAFLQTLKK